MPSVSNLFSRHGATTTSAPPVSNRNESADVSNFDWSRLPVMQRRTSHPWSVHCSDSSRFVATICRVTDAYGKSVRHMQFQFPTEREAHKFAKVYSPPKLIGEQCYLCPRRDAVARHCRNCGYVVCDACSRRWAINMVPKTYVYNANNYPASLTVRVCTSCDWLSNAFCMALLQGRTADAYRLYDMGNINLRTSFADINREAMFPVHCAVMGGSLELVRWLLDTQLCPLFATTQNTKGGGHSIPTSSGRTVLDLAMSGRKPKRDILHYLVVSKGLSINDMKNTTLALYTLESLLKGGVCLSPPSNSSNENPLRSANTEPTMILDDAASDHITTTQDDDSIILQDPCSLCCDKETDCVLLPCGHQMCCTECGAQLASCPACKVPCTVLRIFRQ